ncbi:DUF1592 domain-containing protein [Roseibacillus persicicus]|uniref:DUF1592 domain-containing protein n=1 Tax=Roseibacillus persicicus TaxID=454148 RepID=UPI00398A8450
MVSPRPHFPFKTRHWFRRICLLLAVGTVFSHTRAFANPIEIPETLDDVLAFYCYDCHDDSISKGGLDLTSTPFDLGDKQHFSDWIHVFDRIKKGEMPPHDEEQPTTQEREDFLAELNAILLEADQKQVAEKGRVHGRRLTRIEYEHTLQDLLGIKIPLSNLLPADESGKDFETIADAQRLSHFHLSQYLEAADQALEEAMNRANRGEQQFYRKFNAKQLTAESRSVGQNYRGPQAINGRIYSWARAISFNGNMAATRVPASGWYRITVKNVQWVNPGPDGAVWATLKIGSGRSNEPIQFVADIIEATDEPKDFVCDAWMQAGHLVEIQPAEGTNKLVRIDPEARKKDLHFYHGRNLEQEGYAAIAFDSLTLQRVYPAGTRNKIRNRLLPGIQFSGGKPVLQNPDREIKRLITRFAYQAFRRPVSSSQLTPYLELALARYDETNDLFEALREGYRAILCSPRFLTFVEPPGQLDGYAIASRLSYLFWSSLPDQTLMKKAAEGKLRNQQVLLNQANRLLAHPKSERFFVNFTDQWLQLNQIGFTSPDPRRFRQFDPVLQESMVRETRAFVRELFDKDLSVRNFVQSDFNFLNTRLKTHYQMDDATVKAGYGLQKIPSGENARSGLITQGSILKITADGSVTSPVIRGVWIGERILGRHIPPPPANVPAIEPDIRGAISIRDQLEKHRADKSCAACHLKIDPPGFALESYDPVGRWREFYGKANRSAKIDPSGITLDGQQFEDIREWKAHFAKQQEILARAFAGNLLAYSTGADVRFSDRPVIEDILKTTKKDDYGVLSLLQAVITSDSFLKK